MKSGSITFSSKVGPQVSKLTHRSTERCSIISTQACLTVCIRIAGNHLGENGVIYYNLEVGIQQKDNASAAAFTKTRNVQRRFSDFRRLYAMLCELYPDHMEDKEPPPKNLLARVNATRELIDERRDLLEKWLWKVISDEKIAKSAPLSAFLQLDQAARSAVRRQSLSKASTSQSASPEGRDIKAGSVTPSSPSTSSQALSPEMPHAQRGSPSINGDVDYLKHMLQSETAIKELLAKKVSELENSIQTLTREHEEQLTTIQNENKETMNNLQFEIQETTKKAEKAEQEKADASVEYEELKRQCDQISRESDMEKERSTELQKNIHQLHAEKEAILTNGRADIKTLAREIKRQQKLQGALEGKIKGSKEEIETLTSALREKENATEADISINAEVLREAANIHHRLQECSIDKLMLEDGSGTAVKDISRMNELFQVSLNPFFVEGIETKALIVHTIVERKSH